MALRGALTRVLVRTLVPVNGFLAIVSLWIGETMHDSHVLKEATGKGSVALRVHWTECTDLCFASSLKSVQFRTGSR